jgi:hypothetical protein
VRYVVVEKGAGLDVPAAPPNAGRVLLDSEHLLVVEVAPRSGAADPAADTRSRWGSLMGWCVTLVTLTAWLVVATARLAGKWRTKSNSLVGFRP